MEKSIKIDNKNINYQLKTSHRAKNMRLCIYADGSFVVTKPRRVSDNLIEKFIIEKSSWILDRIGRINSSQLLVSPAEKRRLYLKHKEEARTFIENKVKYFSEFYGFKFNRIAIRSQKTCWGSCSRRGNLNFNYKIMFLPDNLANYVVAHEICHLKEMNHSRNFWNLLAKSIPDYYKLRKELKNQKRVSP
jgi:predicted metal-dependent hydrolase